MHKSLKQVPEKILETAIGALIQANQHAIFYDPGKDHWAAMSVINAALAGELFLKAIIAKEHPLLIFKDLFQLDNSSSTDLDFQRLIESGKTYNFEHLPKLLWVATGERLQKPEIFEELRKARNSIQHFCSPMSDGAMRTLSLKFIYEILDPLISKHFGLCAIEYHEDEFYDYVVGCLLSRQILFTVPDNFEITEIDIEEELSEATDSYRKKIINRMKAKGFKLRIS